VRVVAAAVAAAMLGVAAALVLMKAELPMRVTVAQAWVPLVANFSCRRSFD
jgi:hypothetical protein